LKSAKRARIRARGKRPSRGGLRNQVASAGSISQLFAITFRHAALSLSGAEVAQLLRGEPGDLAGLSWAEPETVRRLRALALNWAERGTLHRHRLRTDQKAALAALLGDAEAWSTRTAFLVCYVVDEAYAGLVDETVDLHPSVQRVARPFLAGISNRPPAIGQMTPIAACRTWMTTFWFVGGTRHLDGFGRPPRVSRVKLPSTVQQSLQRACDEDELRFGLVSWRSHTLAELALHEPAPGCFAVTGCTRPAGAGVMEAVALEAFVPSLRSGCKLPSVSPADDELRSLAEKLVSAAQAARRLLLEGDAAALHELHTDIRHQADSASGPPLLLLEVAETFMRALCRSDLGKMDRALHRFAAQYPKDADQLFAHLMDRGRINDKELLTLAEPARTAALELIATGCLRELGDGALDMRPSLRGLARDLISPPMLRHWREVHEARTRLQMGEIPVAAAVSSMAALLGLSERDASRHLAAFSLNRARSRQPVLGPRQIEQDALPNPVTTPALRAADPVLSAPSNSASASVVHKGPITAPLPLN